MKMFVIYDIEEDKTRKKIFEACKDYGLEHVQYSTFYGDLNHNRREELWQRMRRTLGKKNGKLLLVPLCDKDIKLVKALTVCPEGEFPDA